MNKVYLGLEVYDDHYSSFIQEIVKVFKTLKSAQEWVMETCPTEYKWREYEEFEVE